MKSNTGFATRPLAALLLVAMLGGCSNMRIPFFGDALEKEPSYSGSRNAIKNRSLEVPPDLTSPGGSANFSIPGLATLQISPNAQKILEAGTVLPSFDKARLEVAGGQRWLVIKAAPEAVWPEARKFWLDQGFKLKSESAALGLLETDFLEQKPDLPVGVIRSVLAKGLGTLYSTGIVDQYRMRLERGADPATTEIYISHQGMEEVFTNVDKTETRWTGRKPEPELEAAMLKKMLVRFGITADAATQVVDGSAAPRPTATPPVGGSNVGVQLATVEGSRVIQIAEGFDRAWRRVGLALERNGYTITDRDRQLGVYYVKPGVVLQAAQEKGFFAKLAFWKSDDKKLPEPSSNVPEHQVIVAGKGAQTTIKVSGKDGSALPDKVAASILEPLAEELR